MIPQKATGPALRREDGPDAIDNPAGELDGREANTPSNNPQLRPYQRGAGRGARAPQGPAHDRWICDIPKNSREVLRVQLTEFRGYQLASLRVFYKVDGTDEMRPGKAGFALRVEKLPELQSAIAKALEAARAEGAL